MQTRTRRRNGFFQFQDTTQGILPALRIWSAFAEAILDSLYASSWVWRWKSQSSSALALMHLTCGHYAKSRGYHTPVMWRMWKLEQPPDAVLSPTWSLTDVCGSLDILPAAHHKRTTTLLSLRWSGGCLQIGSDRHEDLATPGFVQWRQTLANRTLALHLPGGRQLFVTTGGALWTQQRYSGVCYERRRRRRRSQ